MFIDLNSEEFYNLMQIYRHTPVDKQDNVIKAFQDVKDFIQKDLCKDCGHEKDNASYHFDAPGTSWGAALHKFVKR